MMMKSKNLSFFSIIFVLFAFSSCHGYKTLKPFEMPQTFDDSKTFELSFWAKNDTNKIQTAVYEKAISDFEKIYPNVKVRMKLYTDYSRIYNDVITNIATKTTPNVCISYPDNIATYKTGTNVVLPLDEISQDPAYGLGGSEVRFDSVAFDDVVPKFMDEMRLDGELYGLPFLRSSEVCYINKSLVEKLGYEIPDKLTWDFIWEVSEKAMEKEEDGETFKLNGQKVLIPFIYKSTDNMMIQYLAQSGASYSNDSGEILIFNDQTKDFLYEVAGHAASRAFSTFAISSYPGNFLNAGQCLFAVDSTAGSTWIGASAPLADIPEESKVDFETAVRLIPQVDTDNPKMISQGPSVCVFNKDDPQEVLASWLFAQFLLTDEIQTQYCHSEGYVPVTYRAQNSNSYQAYLNTVSDDPEFYPVKLEVSKIVLDNIENTFITPVFNGSASLRSAAGQLIENVCKAARRNTKIDDEYMERNFFETASLFHLNEKTVSSSYEKKDLGPLPLGAWVLICSLVVVWLCLAGLQIVKLFTKEK